MVNPQASSSSSTTTSVSFMKNLQAIVASCFFSVFIISSLLFVDTRVDAAGSYPTTFKLLFVGNSYTAGLPASNVVNLMNSVPGSSYTISTSVQSPGGYQLWRQSCLVASTPGTCGATNAIKSFSPTHIILQDQSTMPCCCSYWFYKGFQNLSREAYQHSGAVTVGFQTWSRGVGSNHYNPGVAWYENLPHCNSPQNWTMTYYWKYRNATTYWKAPGSAGLLAPCGNAFNLYRTKYGSSGVLYSSDLSHSSAQGSYLCSAVMAMTITGEDANCMTYTAGLDSTTAATLRAVASEAVRLHKANDVADNVPHTTLQAGSCTTSSTTTSTATTTSTTSTTTTTTTSTAPAAQTRSHTVTSIAPTARTRSQTLGPRDRTQSHSDSKTRSQPESTSSSTTTTTSSTTSTVPPTTSSFVARTRSHSDSDSSIASTTSSTTTAVAPAPTTTSTSVAPTTTTITSTATTTSATTSSSAAPTTAETKSRTSTVVIPEATSTVSSNASTTTLTSTTDPSSTTTSTTSSTAATTTTTTAAPSSVVTIVITMLSGVTPNPVQIKQNLAKVLNLTTRQTGELQVTVSASGTVLVEISGSNASDIAKSAVSLSDAELASMGAASIQQQQTPAPPTITAKSKEFVIIVLCCIIGAIVIIVGIILCRSNKQCKFADGAKTAEQHNNNNNNAFEMQPRRPVFAQARSK